MHLLTMNHRAGFINGEGDGVGIHMDIPKELWKEKLLTAAADPALVDNEGFAVGHVFISQKADWTYDKKRIAAKTSKI